VSAVAATGDSNRASLVESLFFATVFTVTFAKIHWAIAGDLSLSDVLTGVFLVAFAVRRLERSDGRLARPAAVMFGFFVAFLLVYLIGFFNLGTTDALDQWAKGMVKFVLHFLFLAAAVALVVRRGERFYWKTFWVFIGGIAANAVYGLAQLGVAFATGGNLDAAVLSPVTGGASQINIYGAVQGQNVYRPNALTGDPNHLAIELTVPLLVLLPMYLRLDQADPRRKKLMLLLGFLFVMELSTFSRSGLLGLAAGLAVLAIPYRRHLVSRRLLVPLAGVGCLLLALVAWRAHFFSAVLQSRAQTGDGGTNTHLAVYSFIPQILRVHPLFGLGLNNFSVYYEFITGRTNFGPHSYYVSVLVESGLVGGALFLAFAWYLFRRLRGARTIGRALQAAHDPMAASVRPLAWGLTAALVGTLAANAFYLTISFYYFFVFVMLIVATPSVFAPRLQRQ
jgi:O-antigen ligase